MNKEAYDPSDKEKKELLNRHFKYEVNMLTSIADRLMKIRQSDDRLGKNMALESFILHARCLIEFLYYAKHWKHDDDARACDYLKNETEWMNTRELLETDLMKELMGRAGWGMAHLNYKRAFVSASDKKWNTAQIRKDVLKAVRSFLDFLPQECIGKELQNLRDGL